MKVASAFFFIVTFLSGTGNVHAFSWSYGGGESSWPQEQCKSGTKQSPINIDRTVSDFEMVNDMEPFMFSGFNQTPTAAKLMNIGFTVKATFEFTETTQKKPMISGGGLGGNYRLAEIHFRWGVNEGSEHRISEWPAMMEIQMIHINENMEGSLDEVLANTNIKSDSLAILSVLVKKQKSDNGMLKNLFDAVADVKTENLTKDFNGVKLSHLLPRNTNGFYRYNGSLTYPNCTEAAIWTVFKDPLYISNAQRVKFTQIGTVSENYRISKPLGINRNIKDVETSMRDFNSGSLVIINAVFMLTLVTISQLF